ncbi:MAG: hypothetical protein ACLUVF_08740 [Adlercreutzia sp.]
MNATPLQKKNADMIVANQGDGPPSAPTTRGGSSRKDDVLCPS